MEEVYQPIKGIRLYEIAEEKILELINKGIYKEGDKLPTERELAVKLNVSRHTVREAFNKLQTEGRIKVIPGKGAFVLEPNVLSIMNSFTKNMICETNNLANLFEIRLIIEVQAAKLAAVRAKKEDLLNIEKALELTGVENNCDTDNPEDDNNLRFHVAVAKATQNPVLVNTLITILRLYRQAKKDAQISPTDSYKDHRLIYEAICIKNIEKAEQVMQSHLNNVIITL